ncbi:MAG: mobile mystery protein B [Desulfovibrionaceae bacterium]|nr:mobile mystery protein B [Desulfovibrionaceae bacterium]
MKLSYPEGATPLDADECAGLLPKHITTQAELNQWEQMNILNGMRWAKRQKKQDILTIKFLCDLHKKMFSETWKWAGAFRSSNKNIGVPWEQIRSSFFNLLEDVKIQIQYRSYAEDEIAVRFHHRLVSIHPFCNGNGRHSRIMADLLAERLGQPVFSWGTHSLVESGTMRSAYLSALRRADTGEYTDLLQFSRHGMSSPHTLYQSN